MSKDIRVPVALTQEQHQKLTEHAQALGLTLSAFIRMAALEKANG